MPLLKIDALKKGFVTPDGGRHVVVDVPEFELAAGAQRALQGPSGCGKTTFLHLIAGIVAADAGTIELSGDSMTAASESGRDRLRARHIGYVFQSFNLLRGFTALENVLLGMSFGPGGDESRARGLLERVGLGDRLDYLPEQLSTGQQQRVAVARALANSPRLVLADEPTGNLDPQRAASALELIREICRENEAALLLVSHDRAVLDGFDDRMDFADLAPDGGES